MRGAYLRHSNTSASRRPAPPAAMRSSSAASDASAVIDEAGYHRGATASSGTERIGQGAEGPPPISLVGASVHEAEHAGLGAGQLLEEWTDVRAVDQVGNCRLH